MNIDTWKLIKSGGDGGDTCHRMYTMLIRLRLGWWLHAWETVPDAFKNVAGPAEVQALLEVEPGIYRRHPDPNFWGSDPRNHSRDQMTPVICWHALMSHSQSVGKFHRTEMVELIKACRKRWMFAQNVYPNWVDPRTESVKKKMPDFLNFDLWGIMARAFIKTKWAPIALPVILFGDAWMLLSVFTSLWAPINHDGTLQFRWPGPDDVDDDNLNNVLMVSQYTFQTPLSWLARKLYKRFRKKNYGNTKLGEQNAIMGALMWYHRAPAGNPELAEIARPIVEKY
jgi:hypothetical protein